MIGVRGVIGKENVDQLLLLFADLLAENFSKSSGEEEDRPIMYADPNGILRVLGVGFFVFAR